MGKKKFVSVQDVDILYPFGRQKLYRQLYKLRKYQQIYHLV